MTDPTARAEVGRRVRKLREHAGKSRATLAGLVGRSEDWLKFIENGKRGLPLAMAARVARELGATDLTQIFGADLSAPITTVEKPSHAGAQAVGQALTEWPAWDGPPPVVEHYQIAVDKAWRAWHTSQAQRTDTGRVLPDLIRTGRAAVAGHHPISHAVLDDGNPDLRAARVALAATYNLAQAYLAWQADARAWYWLSVDRGRQLAEESDDATARSTSAFYGAHTLRAEGRADEAIDILTRAARELEPLLADADNDTRATYGLVHMITATTMARCNRDPSAWTHWEEADRIVGTLPAGYVHSATIFGRAYVDLHKTVIAAELGDSGEALRHAESVKVEQIPSRQWGASVLVHVAQALHYRRDSATIVPLLQAERQSAESVQFSMPARHMLTELATSGRGPVRGEASELAHRLGVLV
jgi:transcriptional regulator with XRE-family HTH domain